VEPQEEPLSPELDRLERVLREKDAEIQRLRVEARLKDLLVEEFQSLVEQQEQRLREIDLRLRELEAHPSLVKIRIKKSF
jgi:hypothetical protein